MHQITNLKDLASITLQNFIPNYKKVINNYVALHGVFIKQVYRWLVEDIRPGTTVIDIGAFIGETAIYFAQYEGINKVIAYEPYPFLFEQAEKNIALSGLSHKIQLFNAALAEINSILLVSKTHEADLGSELKDSKNGKPIRIYSLNEILKGSTNVIIKSNCEGSEHKIFNNSSNLESVYKIEMHYHYGVQQLEKILGEKGFKVKIQKEEDDLFKGEMGMLYAWR